MSRAETIAIRILANESLLVRSLVQEWLRSSPVFADEPAPTSRDARVRAVAAAVVELLAERAAQPSPSWTAMVGQLPSPVYLVEAAYHSAKLRMRVERESPDVLRKRNVFAPREYLELL